MNTPKSDSNKNWHKVLYVKYMVSLRCKTILNAALKKLELKHRITAHGGIEYYEDLTQEQFHELKKYLQRSGLVLLDEKQSMMIDRIINTIIEVIHYSDDLPKMNFTELFSENAISGNETVFKVFSDVKGVSIVQFIITQKIERVKELLLYDDLTLSEISEKLNYKNKNYLIAQFKKFTGLTPSYFKQLKKKRMEISA
ncbi:MAG: helix-turn-helix domain-containing protein, partial [Balneolaceae bacterium]